MGLSFENLSLHFIGSREIADGLAQIEQLVAYKSALEISLDVSRKAYDQLRQEKDDFCRQLDASRDENVATKSQLDVYHISDIFHCFLLNFMIKLWFTTLFVPLPI